MTALGRLGTSLPRLWAWARQKEQQFDCPCDILIAPVSGTTWSITIMKRGNV